MEAQEVIRLADWFNDYVDQGFSIYSILVSVLQHNAQQANKQPVKEPLDNLVLFLEKIPTRQLSELQYRILEELSISNLLGKRGAKWIEDTVKTNTYDPANTYELTNNAYIKLKEAGDKLNLFREASSNIGITRSYFEPEKNKLLINVIYQNEASISNMRDWKKWAHAWEQIISGLTAAVDEKPEDVSIVGVSNGSIIITLAATATCTWLMSLIFKHITDSWKRKLDVQLKMEELRQVHMLTKKMEMEFKVLETERKDNAKRKIQEEITRKFPNLENEVKAKLDKSIERSLDFGEAGGDVDFVIPKGVEGDHERNVEIEEVRESINELQNAKQEIKLLE